MALTYRKPGAVPRPNILFYGPGKSGKTIGACSNSGNTLLLNADLPNASRTAHLMYGDRLFEPEVPVYDRTKSGQIMQLMVEVTNEVSKPDTIFGTAVVDTVGELHRRYLEEIAQRAVRPRIDYYGDASTQVERFCRGLCENPNVSAVLVCHELLVENGNEVISVPFTGTTKGSVALGAKLISMVDVVCYCGAVEQEDGTTRYVSQIRPGKGRSGGDRFNAIMGVRDTNIAEWIELIKEHEAAVRAGKVVAIEKAKPIELPPEETIEAAAAAEGDDLEIAMEVR